MNTPPPPPPKKKPKAKSKKEKIKSFPNDSSWAGLWKVTHLFNWKERFIKLISFQQPETFQNLIAVNVPVFQSILFNYQTS